MVDVLDRLDAAGIEWWIDGGWAVDALLREQTREHDDLDFAIRAEDVGRLDAVFPEFNRVPDEWGSGHLSFGTTAAGSSTSTPSSSTMTATAGSPRRTASGIGRQARR